MKITRTFYDLDSANKHFNSLNKRFMKNKEELTEVKACLTLLYDELLSIHTLYGDKESALEHSVGLKYAEKFVA